VVSVDRCGAKVARFSNAVIFDDGLSVIVGQTITKFVVRGESTWWVFVA
jgi:hypothetical protein